MEETVTVCGQEYRIIRLLGRGKGGYSYLAEACRKDICGNEARSDEVVLKQIHHEPCDYYTFGNKIEAERNDHKRLLNAGIRIPELYAIDMENERLVKEYISGDTVFERVRDGCPVEPYIGQVREMAAQAKNAGLNIDYFPTNFVIHDDMIWYVDYECNDYMEEWDFEHWGIKYWSRTPEFEEYIENTQK